MDSINRMKDDLSQIEQKAQSLEKQVLEAAKKGDYEKVMQLTAEISQLHTQAMQQATAVLQISADVDAKLNAVKAQLNSGTKIED